MHGSSVLLLFFDLLQLSPFCVLSLRRSRRESKRMWCSKLRKRWSLCTHCEVWYGTIPPVDFQHGWCALSSAVVHRVRWHATKCRENPRLVWYYH
eukprot:scaffold6860_cov162-Amphora_coffeaeformis.AAC.1